MKYCTKCGEKMPDEQNFCTACGQRVAAAAAPAPQQYTPQPPAPAEPYKEEPISTMGYIGISLLLMIPLLNLLLLIIWACGGCAKRNLSNLARASLIMMLVSMVLGALLWGSLALLFSESIQQLQQAVPELQQIDWQQ
ncbi:MAG: zinc ribbon domain-containing protein, partial [Akkermansia sp.]|nr:zinc ribbon domain-containing protein [Akkermansia sp.]